MNKNKNEEMSDPEHEQRMRELQHANQITARQISIWKSDTPQNPEFIIPLRAKEQNELLEQRLKKVRQWADLVIEQATKQVSNIEEESQQATDER